MPRRIRSATARRTTLPGLRLGERLRQLRVAAGLTQSELAGERFSKEYVSQIERGKTRPTRETIEWLAARLGVDAGFLANGVSADERGRGRGDARARRGARRGAQRYDEAVEEFENSRTAVLATGAPELEVRALLGEAWARMERGEVASRRSSCSSARGRSPRAPASPTSSAPRCSSGSASAATSSRASRPRSRCFSEALQLAERSACRATCSAPNILGWRSRCYRRQRDYEAAREDVERALELAEVAGRPAHDRRRLLPGLARRRPRGALGARAHATPSARRR